MDEKMSDEKRKKRKKTKENERCRIEDGRFKTKHNKKRKGKKSNRAVTAATSAFVYSKRIG